MIYVCLSRFPAAPATPPAAPVTPSAAPAPRCCGSMVTYVWIKGICQRFIREKKGYICKLFLRVLTRLFIFDLLFFIFCIIIIFFFYSEVQETHCMIYV